MQIELNNRRVQILHILYSQSIQKGTLKDIAKQIDSGKFDTNTYSFLIAITKKLSNPILQATGTTYIEGRDYPVFVVNKTNLEQLWMNTIYYILSADIVKNVYTLVLE